MPFAPPRPFTPERILAATGNRPLADRAKKALAAVLAAGIKPDQQPLDWGFMLQCGHSTADEYGLTKGTHEPDPDGTNVMEAVAQQLMLLAAVTDPDGGAPGLFFGDDVMPPLLEPRVNLSNFEGWVFRNHPEPDGACNLAGAMERMLELIAKERNLPALAELHALPDNSKPPTIAMDPYAVAVVVEGDPDDPEHFQELLDMTSGTPIIWLILYVSNQKGYVEVYQDMIQGRTNVALIQFPDGAAGLTEDDAFERVAAPLGLWYQRQIAPTA